jgi:hypothetical protein
VENEKESIMNESALAGVSAVALPRTSWRGQAGVIGDCGETVVGHMPRSLKNRVFSKWGKPNSRLFPHITPYSRISQNEGARNLLNPVHPVRVSCLKFRVISTHYDPLRQKNKPKNMLISSLKLNHEQLRKYSLAFFVSFCG